jgi:hypothetical protein
MKFTSLGVTNVILHATEETALDSGFTRWSYDHLTRGGSNLTLSSITEVLPQNWFKTAQPLCMDDSMVIYTLFSSNVGHI